MLSGALMLYRIVSMLVVLGTAAPAAAQIDGGSVRDLVATAREVNAAAPPDGEDALAPPRAEDYAVPILGVVFGGAAIIAGGGGALVVILGASSSRSFGNEPHIGLPLGLGIAGLAAGALMLVPSAVSLAELGHRRRALRRQQLDLAIGPTEGGLYIGAGGTF